MHEVAAAAAAAAAAQQQHVDRMLNVCWLNCLLVLHRHQMPSTASVNCICRL
jgi:hypothetical protein